MFKVLLVRIKKCLEMKDAMAVVFEKWYVMSKGLRVSLHALGVGRQRGKCEFYSHQESGSTKSLSHHTVRDVN